MAQQEDGPGLRLAATLVDARGRKGWTQQDLSDASGVSRQTIIRYESGRASNPEAEALRRVCDALELDIREVLIDLGYLTRAELKMPPKQPALPRVLTDIAQLLQLDRVSDKAKESLLRHVQASVDLWMESMGVRKPPREPSAAERAVGKPVTKR